jgi:twitching motility two-component system response regulator PilH
MALILIVDDSQYQRNVIKKILSAEGHDFIEADNGLAAMKETLAHTPDCILVDKLMPELDGEKFLQFIKQRNLSIPVIVVTADIQESTHSQFMSLGAFAVINKPLKGDRLKEILQRALLSNKKDSE